MPIFSVRSFRTNQVRINRKLSYWLLFLIISTTNIVAYANTTTHQHTELSNLDKASIAEGSVVLLSDNLERTLAQAIKTKIMHAAQAAYQTSAIDVRVLPFNKILDKKPCQTAETEIKGQKLYGRVAVLVKCLSPTRWSFYTSADVEVNIKVIKTARMIAAGEIISSTMLVEEEIDLNRLRGQYLQTRQGLVGKVAKRAIAKSTPMQLAYVKRPLAVQRGDTVSIQAHYGAAVVASRGTALKNGHVGEQITVQNTSSKRIIQPWVWAKGIVGTTPKRP